MSLLSYAGEKPRYVRFAVQLPLYLPASSARPTPDEPGPTTVPSGTVRSGPPAMAVPATWPIAPQLPSGVRKLKSTPPVYASRVQRPRDDGAYVSGHSSAGVGASVHGRSKRLTAVAITPTYERVKRSRLRRKTAKFDSGSVDKRIG